MDSALGDHVLETSKGASVSREQLHGHLTFTKRENTAGFLFLTSTCLEQLLRADQGQSQAGNLSLCPSPFVVPSLPPSSPFWAYSAFFMAIGTLTTLVPCFGVTYQHVGI